MNHAGEVSDYLRRHRADWLRRVFPNGRQRGGVFYLGDPSGAAGDSLPIPLSPNKPGLRDFGNGWKGDDLDLLAEGLGGDIGAAIRYAEETLGAPRRMVAGRPERATVPDSDFPERAAPTPPNPPAGSEPPAIHPQLGEPTFRHEYSDATGRLIFYHCRFDPPGKRKTFRPLAFRGGDWKWEDPPGLLPLYGLAELAVRPNDPVLVVEGEKAAEVARDLLPNDVVVTWPHGAQAVDRVDWAPLAGRQVTLWPDNDDDGRQAMQAVAAALREAGAASVRVVEPPPALPPKWDLADELPDGWAIDDVERLIAAASEPPRDDILDLAPFDAMTWSEPPPERLWLVRGVFQCGKYSLVAAEGGLGKSLLLLKLALLTTAGRPAGVDLNPPALFGGELAAYGNAVFLTAEDDRGDVQRRLHALDPAGAWLRYPYRLSAVTMPDAGGPQHLVTGSNGRYETTPFYEKLRRTLREMPDLVLVIIDPLSMFVGVDLNTDSVGVQFMNAAFAALASETAAAVMASHHMGKGERIGSRDEARRRIRGASGLVDGPRVSYGLWPVDDDEARRICGDSGVPWQPGRVVRGAVVKANDACSLAEHTYIRDTAGLLLDQSHTVAAKGRFSPKQVDALVTAVRRAAEAGHPYTRTGQNGFYPRRAELPPSLRKLGRDRLVSLADSLMAEKRIVQANAKGTRTHQYLDVPGGPFAEGEGHFERGSHKPEWDDDD